MWCIFLRSCYAGLLWQACHLVQRINKLYGSMRVMVGVQVHVCKKFLFKRQTLLMVTLMFHDHDDGFITVQLSLWWRIFVTRQNHGDLQFNAIHYLWQWTSFYGIRIGIECRTSELMNSWCLKYTGLIASGWLQGEICFTLAPGWPHTSFMMPPCDSLDCDSKTQISG